MNIHRPMNRKFWNTLLAVAPLLLWTASCSRDGEQAASNEVETVDLIERKPGEVPPPADFDGEEIEVVQAEPTEAEIADSIPGMHGFVLLEKEPIPLNLDEIKQQIGYPKRAKEQEIEGKVILRILLDRQGRYNRHSLLSDPHSLLSQAVSSQITQLRCTPGIQNGKPVWCWITLPFDFRLIK